MNPLPSRTVLTLLAGAALGASAAVAQQPLLLLQQNAFQRQPFPTTLPWALYGRPGDAAVLFADLAAGQTNFFGVDFALAASPQMLPLWTGSVGQTFPALSFVPSALPARLPIFLQVAEWDPSQGLASLLASNVDSVAMHDEPGALTISFLNPGFEATGTFDRAVYYRLQALPPTVRRVRPLPPQAVPWPQQLDPINPLHPAGARYQMAFRASDLGASGVPEELTAIRWRPLFGIVTPETFPQFELRAAHSDVEPDYTIDPITLLPIFPNSGLQTTYATNPRGGTTPVSIYSGPYAIQPAALLPSGYLPFPAPQQHFVYDGASTLLLETLASPQPGLGAPRNSPTLNLMILSSPTPFASVFSVAGFNGQPSPLQPAAATSGTGGSFLFDYEFEFLRTESIATTGFYGPVTPQMDWQPPIVCGFTPPGTSIQLEFRGHAGAVTTAWSASQDVADGMLLQIRIHMFADLATGAVPWIDTIVVPSL